MRVRFPTLEVRVYRQTAEVDMIHAATDESWRENEFLCVSAQRHLFTCGNSYEYVYVGKDVCVLMCFFLCKLREPQINGPQESRVSWYSGLALECHTLVN